MTRPTVAISLVLAVVGVAVAAGCGGEDDRESARTITVEAASRGDVRVVADEYSFDPRGIVARAREGAPAQLRIALANEGALAHNLRVFDGDRELAGTPTFQGGRTRSGQVELPAGSYRLVCTVGNHEQLGMTGTLEVRAAGG